MLEDSGRDRGRSIEDYRQSAEKMIKKADGTKSTSTEENAEVSCIHFQKLFDRELEYFSRSFSDKHPVRRTLVDSHFP